MSENYADIMNLSRPVSKKHPPMSMHDRAAQFLPFAALTGYDAALREKARLTDRRMNLDESQIETLDGRLQQIARHLTDTSEASHQKETSEVSITYFKPDEKKDGGSYLTVTGTIRKIDSFEQMILMKDGSRIPMTEILEILPL